MRQPAYPQLPKDMLKIKILRRRLGDRRIRTVGTSHCPADAKASFCKIQSVGSLGEVMLRLDPGEGRIRTARSFRAWEGGGEYNVIRGLRKCFRLNTAVITAFAVFRGCLGNSGVGPVGTAHCPPDAKAPFDRQRPRR